MNKPTILILCTGNSCRSHLGEGILQKALGDEYNVQSAGSNPAGYVHPLAIRVMQEIGVDITGHRSKHLKEFLNQPVETVITVCGNADQACPMFPGQVNRYHWGFDDPGHATGTEEEKLAVFRRVRDEIRRVFEAYAAGRKNEAKRQADEHITSLEIAASKPAASQPVQRAANLKVYDPAMCCSTGVCGPDVDPALVRFAADVKWLQEQGVAVERFNLSQTPMAFVENEQVKQALAHKGEAALPVLMANGRVTSMGRYPDRAELTSWFGLARVANAACAAVNAGEGSSKCCG